MGVPPEKISGFKYEIFNYIEKERPHIIRKIENGEFDEKVKEEIIKISLGIFKYFSWRWKIGGDKQMKNAKEIKSRIKSIHDTRKITTPCT